jgi:hypothetical protein
VHRAYFFLDLHPEATCFEGAASFRSRSIRSRAKTGDLREDRIFKMYHIVNNQEVGNCINIAAAECSVEEKYILAGTANELVGACTKAGCAFSDSDYQIG